MINKIKIFFWLLIIAFSAFRIIKLRPKTKIKKEDNNFDNIDKNDYKIDMEA